MADPSDLESVKALFAERKSEILGRYNAVGGGIGRNDNEYVITVYLRSKADMPAGLVRIDGVRLRFEITGEIRPHAG